jgi:hypothetical protein
MDECSRKEFFTSNEKDGRPVLNFWWEWQAASPFWPADDVARAKFGLGEINAADLGLPPELVEELRVTAEWHDTSLNWSYPPDPGPWRHDECARFNATSKALFERCQKLLAGTVELRYHQREIAEDPDLDSYLADPHNFKRKRA